jgi:hypothetical protein
VSSKLFSFASTQSLPARLPICAILTVAFVIYAGPNLAQDRILASWGFLDATVVCYKGPRHQAINYRYLSEVFPYCPLDLTRASILEDNSGVLRRLILGSCGSNFSIVSYILNGNKTSQSGANGAFESAKKDAYFEKVVLLAAPAYYMYKCKTQPADECHDYSDCVRVFDITWQWYDNSKTRGTMRLSLTNSCGMPVNVWISVPDEAGKNQKKISLIQSETATVSLDGSRNSWRTYALRDAYLPARCSEFR